MRTNRRTIGVAVAVAVVVIVVIAVLFSRSHVESDTDASATPQATSSSSVELSKASAVSLQLTQANARMLEEAVASSDKQAQAKAFVLARRTALQQAPDMMPADAVLVIHRETFRVQPSGFATVEATVVQESVPTTFILVLQYEDSQWLISTAPKG